MPQYCLSIVDLHIRQESRRVFIRVQRPERCKSALWIVVNEIILDIIEKALMSSAPERFFLLSFDKLHSPKAHVAGDDAALSR